jgi:hypothetical protein
MYDQYSTLLPKKTRKSPVGLKKNQAKTAKGASNSSIWLEKIQAKGFLFTER